MVKTHTAETCQNWLASRFASHFFEVEVAHTPAIAPSPFTLPFHLFYDNDAHRYDEQQRAVDTQMMIDDDEDDDDK